MEKKPANWIAFYERHGEQEILTFYAAARPDFAGVVSRIKRKHQLADYTLLYAPESTTPDFIAQAFLKINSIDGLVFMPFVEKRTGLRS